MLNVQILLHPLHEEIAIKPFVRIFANDESGVLLEIPCFVVKNKNSSSPNSRIGIMALIHSPLSTPNRLIIGIPFAVRLYSGISYPFVRYTFPY